MEVSQASLDKLAKIRESKEINLRSTPMLRKEFQAIDGTIRPLTLRYYQAQMVLHLMAIPRFVVGDDTGLGKCVLKDTLLATEDGLIPIRDMIPEDMVPDEFRPAGSDTPRVVLPDSTLAPVRAFYYGGVKPTITITTRRGYKLGGSTVHPILVRHPDGSEDFKRLSDVRVGDYVCLYRRSCPFPAEEPRLPSVDVAGMGASARMYTLPNVMSPDLARFLGYLVAEGWVRTDDGFLLSQDASVHPEVHEDMRALLERLFGWSGNEEAVDRDVRIHVNSVHIVRFLRTLGIDPVLSAEKRVPPPIFGASRASLVQFLRGYFDGEGSVSGGVVEVSSASERLLREVQVLLLSLGILSTRRPKRVKGRAHVYWRLQLCGDDLRRFKDEVGFHTSHKNQALQDFSAKKANTNLDVVPAAVDMVRTLDRMIYERVGRHGFKGDGVVRFLGERLRNTVGHVVCGRRDISYATLRALHEAADRANVPPSGRAQARGVLENHYFYDPIVSIEEGEEEVFDVEVDHPAHAFVGNGFVNHNTLESIATLCYLWERNPNTRVLVLTKKSAVRQWVDEVHKFTEGTQVFVSKGTPKQRHAIIASALAATGPTVLVMGHRSVVQDFSVLQDVQWGVFILDECSIVKNPSAQIHQICRHVANQSERVWGLTATLIKNNLVEGFGIYKVVCPTLFPYTANTFIDRYCVTQLVNVGRGRKIKRIVGYKKSDVEAFRLKIGPYYLGRPKHAVAQELPPLVTKRVQVGMSPEQHLKYQEALAGLLTMGAEEKEVSKLTAVTYCQEIVNHLELIQCQGASEKLDELVDILTEGELAGKKVIVFTRFEKMVGIGIQALEKAGVRCTRITGVESEDERKASQDIFQDIKSDVKVVWITMAGSDAINLQAAEAVVFYDTPFAAGDYIQILGRMIRIGSLHDRVVALHLLVEDSIDEKTMDLMERKMVLVEQVLGKRLKGENEDDEVLGLDSGISDLFRALRDAAYGILHV